MKKVIWGFLGVFLLTGCGSTTTDSSTGSTVINSNDSESTTEVTNESSSSTAGYQANTENLEAVKSELENKFNDGEELVKVTIENDVSDDTSDQPHSIIEVRVIDDEARKNMQEMKNAVDSNTATEEQLTAIYGIQLNIEEAAKKLKNENDIVQFVNPDTNGNNVVIALANKTENIIPLVK